MRAGVFRPGYVMTEALTADGLELSGNHALFLSFQSAFEGRRSCRWAMGRELEKRLLSCGPKSFGLTEAVDLENLGLVKPIDMQDRNDEQRLTMWLAVVCGRFRSPFPGASLVAWPPSSGPARAYYSHRGFANSLLWPPVAPSRNGKPCRERSFCIDEVERQKGLRQTVRPD